MKNISMVVVAAFIATGCATERSSGSAMPSDYQLRRAGERMTEKLITDRNFFNRHYTDCLSRAKERGEELPTISVGDIKIRGSNMPGATDYALYPVREGVKIALLNSDMFFVKDRDLSGEVDFALSGGLRRSEDGRHYYLTIAVLDCANDNRIIWNNMEEVCGE